MSWASLSVSFAPPFDTAIQRIDVLLGQAGGVVEPDRLVRALADGFDTGLDAVLAQERRNRFGTCARERHVGFGRTAHVGMPDQRDAARMLLLDGADQLLCGFLANARKTFFGKGEGDRARDGGGNDAAPGRGKNPPGPSVALVARRPDEAAVFV